MGAFRIGGRVIRYAVRENSNSNYLVLNLKKDRVLEVSFPKDSKLSVKKILEKKRPWIEKKYEELSRRKRVVGSKRALYRGKAYLVKVVRAGGTSVRMQNGRIMINVRKGQRAREVLGKWMSQRSKRYATRKAARFVESIGVSASFSIDVKEMKSWGKCVDKNLIIFNWRLVGLPRELAEYVVAHEVVHLAEGGHSRRFERKLSGICSEYKELSKELRSYSTYS